MSKYYLVYKITNTINNMIYIGIHKTKNINDDYMGSGKYLKRAQEKYGLKFFKKEILFECSSEEEMIQKEIDLVDEAFVSRLDTYNLTIGGYGGFYYINKVGLNNKNDQYKIIHTKLENDEEYVKWFSKKVSNGLKNYYENNSGSFFSKKHTNESKRKIGEANSIHQQGKGNSQYGTMWITNGIDNKKIKKDEQIPEGWKKGRAQRHS